MAYKTVSTFILIFIYDFKEFIVYEFKGFNTSIFYNPLVDILNFIHVKKPLQIKGILIMFLSLFY